MALRALCFFCALFPLLAFGADLPFSVKGSTQPALAANGFPFTYSVLVETHGLPLPELARRLELKAAFRSGGFVLEPRGARWSYPLGDARGLVQFLFIVPEDQARGIYRLEGSLLYRDPFTFEESVIALPKEAVVEIGGRR
jgi:hypothetical protein